MITQIKYDTLAVIYQKHLFVILFTFNKNMKKCKKQSDFYNSYNVQL